MRISDWSSDVCSSDLTSNGASPGVPVGIDSEPLPIDTVGVHTFTWTTKPAVSAATTYWVVFSDTTLDGTGRVTIGQCADQGAAYAAGFHDTITSIADASGGFTATRHLRAEVKVEQAASHGALALVGASGSEAAAERQVAVAGQTGRD